MSQTESFSTFSGEPPIHNSDLKHQCHNSIEKYQKRLDKVSNSEGENYLSMWAVRSNTYQFFQYSGGLGFELDCNIIPLYFIQYMNMVFNPIEHPGKIVAGLSICETTPYYNIYDADKPIQHIILDTINTQCGPHGLNPITQDSLLWQRIWLIAVGAGGNRWDMSSCNRIPLKMLSAKYDGFPVKTAQELKWQMGHDRIKGHRADKYDRKSPDCKLEPIKSRKGE